MGFLMVVERGESRTLEYLCSSIIGLMFQADKQLTVAFSSSYEACLSRVAFLKVVLALKEVADAAEI